MYGLDAGGAACGRGGSAGGCGAGEGGGAAGIGARGGVFGPLGRGAAGVVVSIRQPVKPREWMIPVTLSIAVMAVHVLIITSARFRLPLEALLFLPTGYLISKMLPARRAT